jgi:hypothetical protein
MEAIRTFRTNPYLVIGTHNIPTWTTPLILVLGVAALVPNTSLLGHLAGLAVGYTCVFLEPTSCFCLALRIPQNIDIMTGGLGYLKFLAPPERALRWIEGRLNLLARLPHYVSVDQKTYGRFGVLPTANVGPGSGIARGALTGTGPTGQRLGT